MAKEPARPVMSITHVNISESLGPDHLHIRNHMMLIEPDLAKIQYWNPVTAEEIAKNAFLKQGDNFMPLTIFSESDTVTPDTAFYLTSENHPFIRVIKEDDRFWNYKIYWLPVKSNPDLFNTARIDRRNRSNTCVQPFRNLTIVTAPRK